MVGTMARPSSPSVRFTAFDAPSITSMPNIGNDEAERDQQLLEHRDGQRRGERPRVSSTSQIAAARPISACATSFDARRDALVAAPRQLQVVVGEAQRAVAQRDEQHRPDIAVAQIDPEQRGDRQREQDQHAAHRRRALLLDQMPFRPIAADRLAVALQATSASGSAAGPRMKLTTSAVRQAAPERKVM